MPKTTLLLILSLILSNLGLLGSELVYTVDGQEYLIDGFKNASPFYILEGKKKPVPSGGEYELRGDIQELIDSAFLPENFSLIKDPDKYTNRLSEKKYKVGIPSSRSLAGDQSSTHEYWEIPEETAIVVFSGWVANDTIIGLPSAVSGDKLLNKRGLGSIPIPKLSERQSKGHPALWIMNGANCEIIPTEKKEPNTVEHINWLIKTNRLDEAAKLLVENKKFNKSLPTPLHIIALYRRNDLIARSPNLLESKHTVDSFKNNPIHNAAAVGNLAFLQSINLSKNELSKENAKGFKAIHLAIKNGHDASSFWLIDEFNQINTKSKNTGQTPIVFALNARRQKIFSKLFELNAKEIKYEKTSMNGLLNSMCREGNTVFIKYLLFKGADPTVKKGKMNALTAAIISQNPEAVKLILWELESLELENNKNKITYLHRAAMSNNAGAVPMLIEKGVNVDAVTSNHKTALYLAVQKGHLDTVLALIENGANPDIKSKNGVSPIWAATYLGSKDEVGALIAAGANCSIEPDFATELVEYAIIHDIPEIVSIALDECLSPDFILKEQYPGLFLANYYKSKGIQALLEEHGQSLNESNTPQFTSMKKLDKKIRFIHKENPPYPVSLQELHGDITVKVDAIINKDGYLIFPRFKPALPKELFLSTYKSLGQWKASPPTSNNAATNVKIRFPLKFITAADEEEIYEIRTLDIPPVPIKQAAPKYPQGLKKKGVTGKVVLGFIVDEKGNVIHPRILQSSSVGFEEAALQCVVKWKFKPGIKDGKPVKTRVRLPLSFQSRR